MGLFSQKSNSTTTTTQNVTTDTLNSDITAGVANAPILSGTDISYTTNFDQPIADAFSALVNLGQNAVNSATLSAQNSISAVTASKESSESPQTALLKSLTPLFMVVAIGYFIVSYKRGK